MPFSRTGNRLADWASHIVENIDRISRALGNPPDRDRLEEETVADAVERCLERASEAASRFARADILLSELEPSIPWREVRAFGNVVPHEYDSLDERIVRDTILATLPELRAAALRPKARFEQQAS